MSDLDQYKMPSRNASVWCRRKGMNTVPFTQKFPNIDPRALSLLERLLAFDPRDHPTAEEALKDSYFHGFTQAISEPSSQPISKLEFAFEKKKLRKEDILEYHPKMMEEYLHGSSETNFLYPRSQPQTVQRRRLTLIIRVLLRNVDFIHEWPWMKSTNGYLKVQIIRVFLFGKIQKLGGSMDKHTVEVMMLGENLHVRVAVRVTSEDPDDRFKPTGGKVLELSFKKQAKCVGLLQNVWTWKLGCSW